MKKSLLIIGGGIMGMSIAREASFSNLFSEITIIEKEKKLGLHASSRNSGVIHAGFYYSPNSKKALFCSEANSLLRNFCLEKGVEVKKTGKVVVCNDESNLEILYKLYERGISNGTNVSLLDENQLQKYEPKALTKDKFIWSPNTWSANPHDLIKVMGTELEDLKVKIICNTRIISYKNNVLFDDKGNIFKYDFLINAAGAYSSKIAKIMGVNSDYILLPFKGMYLKSKQKINIFKRHIYPVPNIKQPFLGIHTTVTSDGYLKLGPTAFPVLSPENYQTFSGIEFEYLPDILLNQFKLIFNNSSGYRDLAFNELKNLMKSNIIYSAQKLTSFPLNKIEFEWNIPGIRAQLFNKKSGNLEMDFVNIVNLNQYHILNSISPAWTCALKTAKYVLEEIISKFNLKN